MAVFNAKFGYEIRNNFLVLYQLVPELRHNEFEPEPYQFLKSFSMQDLFLSEDSTTEDVARSLFSSGIFGGNRIDSIEVVVHKIGHEKDFFVLKEDLSDIEVTGEL